MEEVIEIKGIKYKIERSEKEISLKRYNEKHKMWVRLLFPKGNQEEGKKIEESIVETLSQLYIERHVINYDERD